MYFAGESVMIGSLFHFSVGEAALVAFLAGISCVFLSYLLITFRKYRLARFVFRDILTLVGLGVVLPVWWVRANGLSFNDFGLPGVN